MNVHELHSKLGNIINAGRENYAICIPDIIEQGMSEAMQVSVDIESEEVNITTGE